MRFLLLGDFKQLPAVPLARDTRDPPDERPTISLVVVGHVDAGRPAVCAVYKVLGPGLGPYSLFVGGFRFLYIHLFHQKRVPFYS